MPLPVGAIAGLGKAFTFAQKASQAYTVGSMIYGGVKGAGEKLVSGDLKGALGAAVSGGVGAYNRFSDDKSLQQYQSDKDKAALKRILSATKTDDQEARESRQAEQRIDNQRIAQSKRDKTSLLEEAEYENRLLLSVSNTLDLIKAYNERKTIEDRKRTSDALKGAKSSDENEKLLKNAIGELGLANAGGGGGVPRAGGNSDTGSSLLDAAITTLAFMPNANIRGVINTLKGLKLKRANFRSSLRGLRDTLNKGGNQFRWQKGQNIPKGRQAGNFRAPTKLESRLTKLANNRVGRGLVNTADKAVTRVGNIKAPSIRGIAKGMNVAALAAETAFAVRDIYKTSTDENKINQMREVENLTGQSLESQTYKQYASTVGGAVLGLAAGAALGSVVPIVGTIIGGAVGFALGKEGIDKLISWATSKIDSDGVPDDPNFLNQYNGKMIDALKTDDGSNTVFRMTPDEYLIGHWDAPLADYEKSMKSWNEIEAMKIGVNGHKGTTLEHMKLMSIFNKDATFNGWSLGELMKYVASPIPKDKKKIMVKRFLEEGLFEYLDDNSGDESLNQVFKMKTGKSVGAYLKSIKLSEDKITEDFLTRFGRNTPEDPSQVVMSVEDYNKMWQEYDRQQKRALLSGANNTRQMATGGILKSQLNLGAYRTDSIQSLENAQSDIADTFENAMKSLGDAMSFSDFDDGIQNYLIHRMLPELGNTLFDLIQSDKNKRKEDNYGLSSAIPIWG